MPSIKSEPPECKACAEPVEQSLVLICRILISISCFITLVRNMSFKVVEQNQLIFLFDLAHL